MDLKLPTALTWTFSQIGSGSLFVCFFLSILLKGGINFIASIRLNNTSLYFIFSVMTPAEFSVDACLNAPVAHLLLFSCSNNCCFTFSLIKLSRVRTKKPLIACRGRIKCPPRFVALAGGTLATEGHDILA